MASGALQIYLYDRVLALFCSVPYKTPEIGGSAGELFPKNLEAHLTNTSLQTDRGEEGVRLFDELIGCQILNENVLVLDLFTKVDHSNIIQQMSHIIAETFRAALQFPVHFQASRQQINLWGSVIVDISQPLENAFELYGIDFLVEHMPSSLHKFQVKILEINAEPAIELTGPRLSWILEDLFVSIAKVCVDPFIKKKRIADIYRHWDIGETNDHLIKCLDKVLHLHPGSLDT